MDAPLVHVVITCMLVDGELEEGMGYSRIGEFGRVVKDGAHQLSCMEIIGELK